MATGELLIFFAIWALWLFPSRLLWGKLAWAPHPITEHRAVGEHSRPDGRGCDPRLRTVQAARHEQHDQGRASV